MVYVALLRGINVGGKNKIAMPKLKLTFERLGLSDVQTYINSGNIIFRETNSRPFSKLTKLLEDAIEEDFHLTIKVLLRSKENIQKIEKSLPDNWVNDQITKCDVMFLWEDFDSKDIVQKLSIKPEIDEVKYVAGAILWRIEKKNYGKSGMNKIVGTKLYRHMTIRNCNTVRKIAALIEA